ncbi:MAG: phage holin family protein [Pirellulales bacterium]
MAHSAKVDKGSAGRDRDKSPLHEMGTLGSHVAAAVVELSELQWHLLIADSKLAFNQSLRSILALVLCGIACLAGVPILSLGLAYGLHAWMGWSLWLCHCVVGLGLLLFGGIAAGLSLYHAASSFQHFHRSANELSTNLAWLKSILRGSK